MTRSRYLFLLGAGWLWFFTALCLVAWLTMWLRGVETKFAIVGMLGWGDSPGKERLYAILYTVALVGTSGFAWTCTKKPWVLPRFLTGLGAGCIVAMTLYPTVRSWLFDFRPSFYEYYLGEVITCLAAIFLSIGATTPHPLNRPPSAGGLMR